MRFTACNLRRTRRRVKRAPGALIVTPSSRAAEPSPSMNCWNGSSGVTPRRFGAPGRPGGLDRLDRRRAGGSNSTPISASDFMTQDSCSPSRRTARSSCLAARSKPRRAARPQRTSGLWQTGSVASRSIGLPSSPKVAEHAIRQRVAHEVKYVRAYGQAIPRTVVEAMHYVISPAFDGDFLDPETLDWCKDLVKQNPPWRLSVQQHKGWRAAQPSLQVLPADPPAPSADFKSVRKQSAHGHRGWSVVQHVVAEKYFAPGADAWLFRASRRT